MCLLIPDKRSLEKHEKAQVDHVPVGSIVVHQIQSHGHVRMAVIATYVMLDLLL